MKRLYETPETLVIVMDGDEKLLVASPDPNRNVAGGPPDEGGMPGTVGETDGETDPYGGHGQGSGGGGNRGKEFDLWDIESFDVWD